MYFLLDIFGTCSMNPRHEVIIVTANGKCQNLELKCLHGFKEKKEKKNVKFDSIIWYYYQKKKKWVRLSEFLFIKHMFYDEVLKTRKKKNSIMKSWSWGQQVCFKKKSTCAFYMTFKILQSPFFSELLFYFIVESRIFNRSFYTDLLVTVPSNSLLKGCFKSNSLNF